MKNRLVPFFIFVLIVGLITACSKQTLDNYADQVARYQSYLPIQKRQVRLYRLDSTVTAPFGVSMDVHSYLMKDSVGSLRIENGDSIYSIYRFITDTLQAKPWQFSIIYRLVLKQNNLEQIDENNLRFIKMANPINADYTWNGNRYFLAGSDGISSDSSLYLYLNWEYKYENINQPFDKFSNTITITEADKVIGNEGAFDQAYFQEKVLSNATYAKGIGLVHRKFLYYTYQPNPNNSNTFGHYEQDSYGIEYTLIK